jgi:putative two-component system response regulator
MSVHIGGGAEIRGGGGGTRASAWNGQLADMRVLVVDDDEDNVELIEQLLGHGGYTTVLSTSHPDRVLSLCRAWKPDLLLLDLHMPRLSGFEVMSAIAELMEEPENLPVLVLTADDTPEARQRALSLGARDFVTKPLDGHELLLRTHNLLQTRHLQLQLQQQNASLDRTVKERTLELDRARVESLMVLAAVGEFHDEDPREHTQRVGLAAARIAQALDLPNAFVTDIRAAAPLHDIGKVAVSPEILCKPGALTDEERRIMMQHPQVGAQILSAAVSPVLVMAFEIARSHHENWDATGYPDGISGKKIPLPGRITAVADVFDALTHARPYKPAWETDRALELIEQEAGRKFDPGVVSAFTRLDPSLDA